MSEVAAQATPPLGKCRGRTLAPWGRICPCLSALDCPPRSPACRRFRDRAAPAKGGTAGCDYNWPPHISSAQARARCGPAHLFLGQAADPSSSQWPVCGPGARRGWITPSAVRSARDSAAISRPSGAWLSQMIVGIVRPLLYLHAATSNHVFLGWLWVPRCGPIPLQSIIPYDSRLGDSLAFRPGCSLRLPAKRMQHGPASA